MKVVFGVFTSMHLSYGAVRIDPKYPLAQAQTRREIHRQDNRSASKYANERFA